MALETHCMTLIWGKAVSLSLPLSNSICSTEISLGYGSPFGRVLFCAWLSNTQCRAQKKPTHVLELQLPKYLRVFQQFYMLLNYNKCKLLLCFRANEQRENPFTSAILEPIFTISWAVFKPHPALPRSSISTLWWPSRQNKVLQASVLGFLKNYWLLTAQPQGHHLTSLTLSFHSAKLFLFCTNTLPALGFSYLNSFLAAHMHCIWLVLLLGFGKT